MGINLLLQKLQFHDPALVLLLAYILNQAADFPFHMVKAAGEDCQFIPGFNLGSRGKVPPCHPFCFIA